MYSYLQKIGETLNFPFYTLFFNIPERNFAYIHTAILCSTKAYVDTDVFFFAPPRRLRSDFAGCGMGVTEKAFNI
ncbi:MAG: hypothetical protein EBR91_09715 [Flavobacteriia bacterium]|nr:hypothetical protein [Flavobacteriia bacterium]NBV68286.1 hypothetical protein [Flavobacteriia bacterium]NBV92431.1 hypothetical protein [Flavobacteriia bacterium]NBY39975.1 hypothetical protein [Flavobacteriia bacterium]